MILKKQSIDAPRTIVIVYGCLSDFFTTTTISNFFLLFFLFDAFPRLFSPLQALLLLHLHGVFNYFGSNHEYSLLCGFWTMGRETKVTFD